MTAPAIAVVIDGTTGRVRAGMAADLYGRHVRLRPAGSIAKPTTRHGIGDAFGFLVDIGSSTHLALRRRHDPDDVRVLPADAYRIEPYPFRRVHVFFYPYNDENFWTWCREVGGDVLDSYSGLDRYGSRDEAWTAAQEWLEKALAKDAEVGR